MGMGLQSFKEVKPFWVGGYGKKDSKLDASLGVG
jgi:hypothetical protein